MDVRMVLAPTFAVAVGGVFSLRKTAASVFPWSKPTPLLATKPMDTAADPPSVRHTEPAPPVERLESWGGTRSPRTDAK